MTKFLCTRDLFNSGHFKADLEMAAPEYVIFNSFVSSSCILNRIEKIEESVKLLRGKIVEGKKVT